jgi:hypothetical protein
LKCKICQKEAATEGFCEFHSKAYKNLVTAFDVWKRALGISWKEYLSQIAESSSAGDWVKEVAKYLITNGET